MNLYVKINSRFPEFENEVSSLSGIEICRGVCLTPLHINHPIQSYTIDIRLTVFLYRSNVSKTAIPRSPFNKGETSLESIRYQFIKSQEKFHLGWEEVEIKDMTTQIAYREKALVDLIHFRSEPYVIYLEIEKWTNYREDLDLERLIV